jgi:DNA repair protein SbcD/Mre11
MEPFSFIHAADLHLDTPFTGVGRVDPKLQKTLRDASLTAFDNLIHAAVRNSVDFVLLAGDIYDGIEHGVRAQARFLKGLRELDRHNIKSFFIHGNHDPVEEGWSALRPEDLPASAIRFDQSNEVLAMPVIRDGKTIAVVHGISFRLKSEGRNLSKLFPVRSGGDRPFHIGLLHCNVGRQDGHGDYAPCSLNDLCNRSIDYWALGHIHKRTVLSSRDPVVLYPGNLQARRFDESGPKGATLVRIDSFGTATLELLQLDVIRFAHLHVNVNGNDSLDQILLACEERCTTAVREANERMLIARITLEGATAAHSDLLKTKAQDELLSVFSDRLQTGTFYLDAVLISTKPPLDRNKAAQSGGFEAALLRLNDDLFGSDDELQALFQQVRTPLLKRGHFDEFLPESEIFRARGFVQQAESKLLGMLDPDSD